MSDGATTTQDIMRPPKELIEQLKGIGSATAAGELKRTPIPSGSYIAMCSTTPSPSSSSSMRGAP